MNDPPNSRPRRVPRGIAILVVVSIALLMSAWRAHESASITYDTASFIRFAKQMTRAAGGEGDRSEKDGVVRPAGPALIEVLKSNDAHPGFPALIAVFHGFAEGTISSSPTSWIQAAQWVSILGFGVLVWGVFAWVDDYVGSRAAWTAALVTAASPLLVSIAADALSDSWAVALCTWSGVWICRCLSTGRMAPALVGGIFAALGYLVRPEAAQLALAAPVPLALKVVWPNSSHRLRWTGAILLLLAPVMLSIGSYSTIKGSVIAKKAGVLQSLWSARKNSGPSTPAQEGQTASASAPAKVSPNIHHRVLTPGRVGTGFALLLQRWAGLFGYVLAVPAIVGGMLACRGLIHTPALSWLAIAANGIGLPIVLYGICGYLSFRHVVVLFVLTVGWVWPGCLFITSAARNGFSDWARRRLGRGVNWPCSAPTAAAWSMALILAATALLAPQGRLNSNVAGLRNASEWLARYPSMPSTDVYDMTFVVSLYADLDAENRWLWPVNHDLEQLAELLKETRRDSLLVVTDSSLMHLRGSMAVHEPLHEFEVEEITSFLLDEVDGDGKRVRIFRIAARLAGNPKSTAH